MTFDFVPLFIPCYFCNKDLKYYIHPDKSDNGYETIVYDCQTCYVRVYCSQYRMKCNIYQISIFQEFLNFSKPIIIIYCSGGQPLAQLFRINATVFDHLVLKDVIHKPIESIRKIFDLLVFL